MAEAVRPEKKKKKVKKYKISDQNSPLPTSRTKFYTKDTIDQNAESQESQTLKPVDSLEVTNEKGEFEQNEEEALGSLTIGKNDTNSENVASLQSDNSEANVIDKTEPLADEVPTQISQDDQEVKETSVDKFSDLLGGKEGRSEEEVEEKNSKIIDGEIVLEGLETQQSCQKECLTHENNRHLSSLGEKNVSENISILDSTGGVTSSNSLDATSIPSQEADIYSHGEIGNFQADSQYRFMSHEIKGDELTQNYQFQEQRLFESSNMAGETMSPQSQPPIIMQIPHVPVIASRTLAGFPEVAVSNQLLSPFTDEQLKMFYFNPELEQISIFIDQFLQNCNKDTHDFYDLVNTHYKCRIQLLKISDQIKTTRAGISSVTENVWITEKRSITGEGFCKDRHAVKQVVDYQQVEFCEKEAVALDKQLNDLRGLVHEDFQLISYNSQLAKIRVECYVHELLQSSTLLNNIRTEDPVSAALPRSLSQDDVMALRTLQDAITILFSFKRLGEVEEEFCKDIDSWLTTLVSVLLRAGALPDHFFILNHILRCPPGSAAAIANFIQFADFNSILTNEVWDSPLVHHFVVMLATIALPIKERASFLLKYKHAIKPTTVRSMSWTLVDEDREEDENPEDSWSLLLENDLVAIFEQYPFESLFQYLLRMDGVNGDIDYSVTSSTSNDIVHLLAFTSCIVRLLGRLFETYNMLRYRQFVKRISRTIRWVVQVVSDHWCAYRNWRIEICGDSDKDVPSFLTVVQQFSLERLQLEFDQFFTKATEQILCSQSTGALQFLASMPYDAISTNAAWTLLNRLIGLPYNQGHLPQTQNAPFIANEKSASGEMIFFLTALSNMVTSRSSDDKDFIESATKSLLEVTYSNANAKEFCEKDCRTLLASISSVHPFVLSKLLLHIGSLTEKLEESCIYLLKPLPFDIWIPKTQDLEQLRSWLLENSLDSLRNRMARIVISKMNFDIKDDTGALFLDQKYHYAFAVMLVEVFGSCVPDGPGGLKNLWYDEDGIIDQMSALAYQSINKILHSHKQEEFLRWCWDVMLSLKLHASDVEQNESDDHDQIILLSLEESQSKENGQWFANVLSIFEKLRPEKTELEHCPAFINVQRALDADGVLACYAALSMTSMGHSPDNFLKNGVKVLTRILESGWIDAVHRIISNVIPLFLNVPDLILANHGFSRIMDTLVHMDANKAGYTERLWQYPEPGLYSQMLASIISNHVVKLAKKSMESCEKIITCWFSLLVQSQNWYRDFSVQYLLDQLCKVTQMIYSNMDVIVQLLLKQFQSVVKLQSNRGILSSMMSWISTSAPITFLDIKKQPDYSYFAFAILQMERWYEEKIGVYREMTSKMALDPKLDVEIAYKKATSRSTASYLPPLQYLSIYRWAEQGLSTNRDHPLLPLVFQQFFMLFLQKQNTAEGLPSRIGVGDRFFDSPSNATVAKKLRGHLYSLASHHKEKSMRDNDSEETNLADLKSHIHDETMHATLASLYQAMALWLEEPRLHDPSLCLDALPEIYKSEELEKIFQGNEALWLNFVDSACIEKEIDSIVSMWTISINKSTKTKTMARILEENQQLKPTATQRLLKRLNRENKPKCPFAVEITSSPIQEVSMQLLLTRPRLIQEVNNDLERMLLFAKRSCVNLDEHTALDKEYCDLYSDLYENILRHVVLHICCDTKKPACTGPAKVAVRYEEKHVKERVARNVDENRNKWGKDMEAFTKQLPDELCSGAVYVENLILKLVKSLPYANPQQKHDLEDAGIELFYLFASLINNDVKRSHPAIQFFSSSTEVLGKELIADNEDQQLRLIRTIISEEPSVSFLAPHFNPRLQLRTFLNLYSTVAGAFSETTVTTSFVLLSKFDIRTWVSLSPSTSECVFLARTIVSAMENFGKEPPSDVEMLFGLYRSHMAFLLGYRYPQQYSEVLRLIVEASNKESLPSVCWSDFLGTIRCDIDQIPPSPTLQVNELSLDQINESILWLSGYFSRISEERYYSNSKLYSAWKLYIPHVTLFIKFLFGSLVAHYNATGFTSDLMKERFLGNTWNQMFTIYRPWIVPRKADKSWPVLYVEDAILFVQSFTEAARVLADCRSAEFAFSVGMNMLWAFYCAEIASSLNQENALEIYHGLLVTLPWRSFCPSVQDLQRLLELYYGNAPAFQFLGSLLCNLDWTRIMTQYERINDFERLVNFLFSLLRTFVTLSTSKQFMAKTHTKFEEVANTVIAFPWNVLTVQNIETVCGWFAENCDPIAVIEEESSKTTVLRLLNTCCSVSRTQGDMQNGNEYQSVVDLCIKENVYVRTMAKIVTRAANISDYVPCRLNEFFSTLLIDIESWSRCQSQPDAVQIYISLLGLLNSVSPGLVLSSLESRIHGFLTETNSNIAIISILSAGYRVIASLDHLVSLSEIAIESFFNRQGDNELHEAWTRILEVFLVPELNQAHFVRKALTKQALLTVYVYNLQRFSLSSSLAEDLGILTETFHWCLQTPPSPICPEKTLLIWWQILNEARKQVFSLTDESKAGNLAEYLQSFANYCHQCSEDKSNHGILGAIGLGKKSSFPPEFRLVARSLNVFLLAQLPNGGTKLRCFPDAPGDVKGVNQEYSANQEAKAALQNLSNLKKNKIYASFKSNISWIHEFISNPKTSLLDGPDLLLYITKQCYYKISYVAATIRDVSEA